MENRERFELRTEQLGCLPVLDHFFARMDFDGRLGRYLPQDDPRLRLAPGAVCGVVVRNIVVRHRPLYAIGEWVAPYDPVLLGLSAGDAPSLNDDRVGRCLDRLFDADRASLLTETVLHVVRTFGIDCSELHNDSTTVTVTGGHYDEAGPPVRGGVKAPVITFGHNKVCVSQCASFSHGVANSPIWGRVTCIRSPWRRPRRTCTAAISPRWTRCNTVWRATQRIEAASSSPTQPSGTSSATRARRSSSRRIRQGEAGSGRSPTMKPSRIHR